MQTISPLETKQSLEGQLLIGQDQERTIAVRRFGNCQIVLEENAQLDLFVMGGSQDGLATLEICLRGRGARAIVRGMFFVESGVEASTILITHEASESTSDCRLRSLVMAGARFDVKGIVRIPQGSAGADTYFSSHVVVIGGSGHIGNTPSMEIRERRVKAGHAASVSALDSFDQFYAQSRGISADGVVKMLTRGFMFSDISADSPFLSVASDWVDVSLLQDE